MSIQSAINQTLTIGAGLSVLKQKKEVEGANEVKGQLEEQVEKHGDVGRAEVKDVPKTIIGAKQAKEEYQEVLQGYKDIDERNAKMQEYWRTQLQGVEGDDESEPIDYQPNRVVEAQKKAQESLKQAEIEKRWKQMGGVI